MRANVLGLAAATAFCLINLLLAGSLLIAVFLLTVGSSLWDRSPAATAFKEHTFLTAAHLFFVSFHSPHPRCPLTSGGDGPRR